LSAQATYEPLVERLLTPIPGDNPCGADVKNTIHDEVKELRKRDNPEGALGQLREGEAREPNWKKAEEVCAAEIEHRSKDLQLAVWWAEARFQNQGIGTLSGTLNLVKGFHERYWEGFYPVVHKEDELDDLELRAARLNELDTLLQQCVMATPIVPAQVGEQEHGFWEWKSMLQILQSATSIKKPEEKERALAEARERRDSLSSAADRTKRPFYESLYWNVLGSLEASEQLRTVVESKFKEKMTEGVPRFLQLRNILKDLRMFAEDVLKRNGGLPEEIKDSRGPQDPEGENSEQPDGSDGRAVPLSPRNREDALRRLKAIAEFFQRTEPHSPISYLVQRAAKWGSMPLEELLNELVRDPNVLSAIRETLGLPEPKA
jgi:type VI secretion system protein ImpA